MSDYERGFWEAAADWYGYACVDGAERALYLKTLLTLERLLDEALTSGGVDADTDKSDEALHVVRQAVAQNARTTPDPDGNGADSA